MCVKFCRVVIVKSPKIDRYGKYNGDRWDSTGNNLSGTDISWFWQVRYYVCKLLIFVIWIWINCSLWKHFVCLLLNHIILFAIITCLITGLNITCLLKVSMEQLKWLVIDLIFKILLFQNEETNFYNFL